MASQAGLWYNEYLNTAVLGGACDTPNRIHLDWRCIVNTLPRRARKGNSSVRQLEFQIFQTYKLYALRHPLTKEVRYIGITAQSLDVRLKQHLSDPCRSRGEWLNELREDGLVPEIVEIEDLRTFNRRAAERTETFYIKHLLGCGHRLINVRQTGHHTQ